MKTIVITGGAGGMGAATALLVGRDHHLLLSDVNQPGLDATRELLEKAGIHSETIRCDISDKNSVFELVDIATGKGSIASVIHTAGISPQMADPETILKVNSLGTINITEAFYEVAGEGFALINVASMAAHMLPDWMAPKKAYKSAGTNPDAFLKQALFRCRLMPKDLRTGFAYSISKNFVVWYSKKNAARFGEKGARILSVSPGTFDTEMGRLEEKSGSMEMLNNAAIKRVGKPEEIAELLAFCASEKASYLTGIDILCDGGIIASRVK